MFTLIVVGFAIVFVVMWTGHASRRSRLRGGGSSAYGLTTSESPASTDAQPSTNEHLAAHYGLGAHERALVEMHGMDPHHVGAMHLHEAQRAGHDVHDHGTGGDHGSSGFAELPSVGDSSSSSFSDSGGSSSSGSDSF
jgi:hypothetical protein